MGILDQFDGSETAAEYESFLSAKDVREGQSAMICGLGMAKMEDGEKPIVILEGKWTDSNGAQKRALVIKRSNGNRLAAMARKAGGEAALRGSFVLLRVGTTTFRGKDVPTIDLHPGGEPLPATGA